MARPAAVAYRLTSREVWWLDTLSGLEDEPEVLVEFLDYLMEAETDDGQPNYQTRCEAFLIRAAVQKPHSLVYGG